MPITGSNLRKELYPLRMVSPEGDVFEKKFLPACNIFPFPSVYRIERQEALSVSGCTITLKGNDDGCSLATWTDGTYAYSISVASPISGEAFRSLLERNF